MYILYIDESGDVGIRGSNHFVLGGVAIFEGAWSKAKGNIESLLRNYFPHLSALPELHAKEIFHGNKNYRKLSKPDRMKLLGEACKLLSQFNSAELFVFTVIIEKKWWSENRPDDQIYEYGFEELVSRFDLLLARRHAMRRSTKGLIILDENKTSLVHAIKKALSTFHVNGTRWASIRHIIENALFFPSQESPGVQLADICSWAVLRLVEKGDSTWVSQFKSRFDREPSSSPHHPGKWHGVKYFGSNIDTIALLDSFWTPRP